MIENNWKINVLIAFLNTSKVNERERWIYFLVQIFISDFINKYAAFILFIWYYILTFFFSITTCRSMPA